MIKNLRKRIFTIITLSLSILIIGTILLFTYLNYRNTTRTTRMFIDRVTNNSRFEDREGFKMEPKEKPEEKPEDIEEKKIEISDEDIEEIQENANKHIKTIFIYCGSAIIISLILIYMLANKITNIIVKPVEETFEKQKQFISDASHELKTPLAVIEANADVLETNIGENKWLKYIQNETESMNKLINELLVLAKIENIDNIRKNETFNLTNEIEKISSVFEGLAFDKNIKIKTELQEDVKFNGSKEDIEHILSTLIDNAIKHTKENKDLIVRLNKEKGNIIIKVENFGDEIPEEDREKIFERFYRVDKARNRNEKRYGLGLAICKSTVEKYKGKISVDYKDGYTIFKIEIPN